MALSEFTLIYRYFSSLGQGEAVDLSVGDDCAILHLDAGERLATSVDTMVAAVHFPEDSFPEDIGFRAVSAAASDLALEILRLQQGIDVANAAGRYIFHERLRSGAGA